MEHLDTFLAPLGKNGVQPRQLPVVLTEFGATLSGTLTAGARR
jgi:hypothetical protein